MEGDFDLNVCEGDYDMCIYIYVCSYTYLMWLSYYVVSTHTLDRPPPSLPALALSPLY